MTIELRSLRISAELDATGYTNAANQKVGADKAMSASGKEAAASIAAVGAAATATETKVSQSGNVMERLSRQFVDGYGSAQRASAAVNALSREIDKSGYDAARVLPILEGIHRKYGQLGDAAQFAARGQAQLAAAITNTTSRMQAQANVTRIGGAANQNFNTANIAAQFQDIAVTSAMGMSPLQIALQQGTQLSAVLGGQGAAGAARMLGSALLSIVNPVSLITIGLVAASAAAIQYFSAWSSSSEKTKEDLEKQEQLIGRVATKWGEAAPAIKAYNDELERTKSIGDLIAAQQALVQQQYAGPQARLPDLAVDMGDIQSTMQALGQNSGQIAAVRKEFDELTGKIKAGTATGEDALEVQRLINTEFLRGAGNLQTYIDQLGDFASAVDAANAGSEKFRLTVTGGILRGPNGNESVLNPLNPLDGFNRTPFQTEEEIWLERQQREEQQRENERLGRLVPIPTPRPNDIERLDMEGGKKSETTSESFIRSQRERIETIQAELGLAGQIDSVREETLASLRAEQEIRRQGLDIYGEEAKAIRENAALELRLTQQLIEQRRRAAIRDDLGFERSQLFRTPGEQQIASRLRDTGMSLNGPEAQQMRDNQRFAEAKEMVTGFASDFKAALLDNGGDIGDAFAQSILNAASKAMDKAWENIFDQLGNAVASWMTGVTPGGGVGGGVAAFAETGGGLMGMLGGANDNYAPGAVMRAPLGNAAYRDAIASIESAGSGGYAAIGPTHPTMGRALGRYQIMEANIGPWSKEALGKSITADQFMGSPGYQDAIFDSKFGGYVDKFGEKGAAQAWFGGPGSVGKLGRSDVLGTTVGGYGDKFTAALDKVGASSQTASQALDKMATQSIDATKGLSGIAQSAMGFFPGAPKASGMDFASMFGGGFNNSSLFTGLFANFNPMSAMTGLFHEGGIAGFASQFKAVDPRVFIGARRYHDGGLAGDEVPAILRRGEPVFKSMEHARQVVGAGNNNRAREKVELHVHVNGGSGDDHIRKLSQQGAQAALAEYHQAQVQGGIGETQKRFASQKG